jgi:hypothetical protein
MIGIGWFPFAFVPWIALGPIAWGLFAMYWRGRNQKLSVFGGVVAALSIVIPLIAWMRSGIDAGVAGLVISVPSFFTLLLLLFALGLKKLFHMR